MFYMYENVYNRDQMIVKIRRMLEAGYSVRAIVKTLNVSKDVVKHYKEMFKLAKV